MRHSRTLLLLCVCWISLFWTPAQAVDEHPPPGVMEVVPEPDALHEHIRLDSAEVTVRPGQRIHVVDAIYEFYNTGETVEQRIGFPIPIYEHPWRGRTQPTTRDFNVGRLDGSLELPTPHDPTVGSFEMEVRVDGRRVALSEERDFLKRGGFYSKGRDCPQETQEPGWMATAVRFSGHAKTVIRCKFKSWSRVDRMLRLGYGTGRNWTGNIGKLLFVIDCADVGGTKNVDVTTDFRKGSEKGLRSENLISIEQHDFEPTDAAHIGLDVDSYRSATCESAEPHEVGDAPRTEYHDWIVPQGQLIQMWSQVDYDPKLNHPFFRSNEWSCPHWFSPDGQFTSVRSRHADPAAPLPRREHTAKCYSTSFGLKHPVHFCKARLLDGQAIDLLFHQDTPAFSDFLKVRIRDGRFTCQYWNHDGTLSTKWTTTQQKLTLDKKMYQKGDVIKGRIDFECLGELFKPLPQTTPEKTRVFGVFRTRVE